MGTQRHDHAALNNLLAYAPFALQFRLPRNLAFFIIEIDRAGII